MIVYCKNVTTSNCGLGTTDCFLCQTKKCTRYDDNVLRVEVDETQFKRISELKHIKILKVIGGLTNGN